MKSNRYKNQYVLLNNGVIAKGKNVRRCSLVHFAKLNGVFPFDFNKGFVMGATRDLDFEIPVTRFFNTKVWQQAGPGVKYV